MRKEVFLEYKFGDYDMDLLRESGADGFVVAADALTRERIDGLRSLGMRMGLHVGAFDSGDCPLNPEAKPRLGERLKKVLRLEPGTIWLDHFRFDGYWEAIRGDKIPGVHRDCRWCCGENRAVAIAGLAEWVKSQVPDDVMVGCFVVPFKGSEVQDVVLGLGQDNKRLGEIFDILSPMIYHRMIHKPVSYISAYLSWLASLTSKPVLPTVQVKDMPDDLLDRLGESEMGQVFKEAAKPPSMGVVWFSWDGAVEKGKTGVISALHKSRRDIVS